MIEQTQREYSGRFLFELIQNAYDREPQDGEGGWVVIVLAEEEGDHGTLYAANTGRGFDALDVRRIGSLGLSDKRVGEGIGNKGVGFKSVLQVCSAPEIYSTLPDGSPGFCFRFATPHDIPALVDGDPEREAQVLDELSLYNLTVPVEGVPARVARLWTEGAATVVRLPLRQADAADVVRAGIADLESSDVPVMLFLDRLRRVEVRRESGAVSHAFVLGRDRGPSLNSGEGFDSHVVDLGDEGRFLVFERRVNPEAVHDVVRQAIVTGQLDKRWSQWTAPVSVSVALPRGTADAATGRCYTYLPMGPKAPSPLAGHLNAPFFTNFARTDIPLDHPLNDLLVREVAQLCLDAAAALTRRDDPSTAADVLDLVTWAEGYLPVLEAEAARTGIPLADRPVIPTREPQIWTTLGDVWRWPSDDTAVLTSERASAVCGVRFLPGLPAGRWDRLTALMSALKLDWDPEPERLANWVEAVMAILLAERRPVRDWEDAYTDLAILFARAADALRGRKVLLTDDWELRPCAAATRTNDPAATAAATPFFPPARQRVDDEDEIDADADLDLPKSLARRVFYVHRDLTWYANGQQTRARRFLQSNNLVRRFDMRSILDHVRGELSRSRSVGIARDALHLAFNLIRAGGFGKVDLKGLGLRVPTAGGAWAAASSCYFSAGWPPDTNGDDLSTIGGTPEERSPELHNLGRHLLAPPDEVMAKSGDRRLWTRFLREIGVRDVIALASVTDQRLVMGQELVRWRLGQVSGLPEAVNSAWQRSLPTGSSATAPYTPYRPQSPLFWLPGQGDWERLTSRVRGALARQILTALKGPWAKDTLTTVWEKDRPYNKDYVTVPTPLRAFLTETAWLPVQRPGQSGNELVRPGQCWTFPVRADRSENGPPRFAPLLSRNLRELLDDHPAAIAQLRGLGVGVWGSDPDAARLVRHLGDLAASDVVADVHGSQFQAMYRAAWTACTTSGQMPFPAKARCYLVADVGGVATALVIEPLGHGAEPLPLVVASTDEDKSLLRLLADFRRPVLTIDAHVEKAVAMLRQRIGAQVVAATDVAPAVLVDGAPFTSDKSHPGETLVDLVPQLPVLVATLVEFRRSSFDRGGQRAFDDTLDALRRVRIVHADRVEVRIGDDIRPLPERLYGVLSIPHPDRPSIVIEGPTAPLTWQAIELLAEPLLHLVGRPHFTDALRLAAARLRAAGVPFGTLDDDDLALACGVNRTDVRTTARRVETAITPLLTRLYPIVVHFAGAETAAAFDPESTSITSEAEARDAAARLAETLPCPPGELLDAALNTSSLDQLRQALRIPLKALNETLATFGGRYPAMDYSGQHADDFADHARAARGRILDRIRWARWRFFTAFEPQLDWTAIRDTKALTPDPAWGTTLDQLSTDLMDLRIETELARLLDAPPPTTGDPLQSVDECAKHNKDLIGSGVGRLTQLVRAWLTARGRSIAAPWVDPESAGRATIEALDRCGALDFAPLSLTDILIWLGKLGLWPADMPASDDLTALKLTPADLDAQRSEEQRRRAEAARQRRTVIVDDEPFDLDDGLAQFAATLDASLARTPAFLKTSRRHTTLAPIADLPGGRPGSGGGGSTNGYSERRLTDAQRGAIGFAGEWLAYQWLQHVHGTDFTPACWVSEYRQEMFAEPGDDGLGWDFAVPVRRLTYLYEVKTSRLDGSQIELGETQVRAAQRNAKNDHWRLIVITNVLNEHRQLHVLRNPFHEEARGRYTFVGQGLRLRYRLD
ncbi:sacsin N-terminal ATP-binding-like domain-containing protein [Dactylosporangium sp. CA-092794]|uniref:sacsin N-terminal ATP-binding-like domain-containing protein n=1 Tax=Dactylosporangium sp. CA-092794 TaxID=3239929 RepID=UPI003D924DC3